MKLKVCEWKTFHYFGVDEENKWVAAFSTRWRKVRMCLDQIGNPTYEFPCNFIGDYMDHVLWADFTWIVLELIWELNRSV